MDRKSETPSERRAATVIQFPGRGLGLRRAQTAAAAVDPGPDLPTVEFGSGWYHEAAVQEALRKG